MNKSGIRKWGVIAGIFVGMILCLISHCLNECDSIPLRKQIETVQTFLVSFPGYIVVNMGIPDFLVYATLLLYWMFLGWIIAVAVTMESKHRTIVIGTLLILLVIIHGWFYIRVNEMMDGVGRALGAILSNMAGVGGE